MKKMRGIFAAITAMVISLTVLMGCGTEAEPTGYEGKYVSVSGESMGITLTGDEVSGWTVELNNGGKGKIEVNGEKANMDWTLDGDAITISVQGEEMTGTLDSSTLVLDDILGMGMKITFEKEETGLN